ncbi:MAG TPA: GNAT family N-acetyltransferase [Kofleriaceae bacterium]|nr:GNAT family N-acetyltransferase [Kofleriaceae bacterium]
MNARDIEAGDLEVAGSILYNAFSRSAETRGHPAPWPDENTARDLLAGYAEAEPGGVVVVEEGGAVVGVGAVRIRGESASIGPLASWMDGRGIGGRALDELIERAEGAGASSIRLYVDAWNPGAYALYAGRGFAPVDVVSHLEREPGNRPQLGISRGLVVRAPTAADLDEVARLDATLTGNTRPGDLERAVRYVARRSGAVVGYLGFSKTSFGVALGPAVCADMTDLTHLVACALADGLSDGRARARLSTATSPRSDLCKALGFRVRELGLVLSRGAPPPARLAQLYSVSPEIL